MDHAENTQREAQRPFDAHFINKQVQTKANKLWVTSRLLGNYISTQGGDGLFTHFTKGRDDSGTTRRVKRFMHEGK